MTAEQALRTAVGQALHHRAGLLADARTNVCRLVDLGELPLPLSAERFAHAVVLQDRAEPATAPGEPGTVLEAMAELLGPGGALDIGLQAIYVKPFHRDRSHRPDDKSGPLYQPEPARGPCCGGGDGRAGVRSDDAGAAVGWLQHRAVSGPAGESTVGA